MQSLTNEQKLELADLQVHSIEVAKVPVTPFDTANKQYVDAQVVSADNRVTEILAGSADAFNTLIELKNALDSGDTSVTTALTSALGTETANRQAGDTALNLRVDSSHSRLSTVESGLSDETTLRTTADGALGGRIDTADSNHSTHKAQYEADRILDRQRVTDDIATQASSDSADRSVAKTLVDNRFTDNEVTLSSHTSSISTIESDHSTHVSQYEADRILDRQRVTDDIATQSNVETGKNAQVLSDLRSEIATESGVRVGVESGLDSRASALETASSELTELVSANETAIANEVINRGNALSTGLNEKLNVSEKYAKRDDGNLVINADAFLYIGNFWRIRASATASSKRLEFEYSATGANLDFKTAVPFIRGSA
jgi:hypothetical protein